MNADANQRTEPWGGSRPHNDVPAGFPVVSDCVEYLSELRTIVDDLLERRLHFPKDCPNRLAEAMRYSLLAPGKRLRPILALVAYELCSGTDIKEIAPVCVALEAVHTYSLIHDDLPAMDDDDLRRGRPTCHRQFDEATAILAGDALLTFAFEVLSEGAENPETASRLLEATRILSHAAGATGMVGGQADDVLWSSACQGGGDAHKLIDETIADAAEGEIDDVITETGDVRKSAISLLLKKIHRRKTGALFGAAVELGALMGEASVETRVTLRRFGYDLGLAFQIADDLLDVVGDEAAMGKNVHKDADANKLTFPALYGVEATREKLALVVSQAKSSLLERSCELERRPRALETLLYLIDFAAGREK